MQPKEVVDVGLFFSEWSRCLTGKYQSDHLYRFGKFDDCARQWHDLKTGFRAKVSRDEAYARQLMRGTHYAQRLQSPTAGVIWELKETPGWE